MYKKITKNFLDCEICVIRINYIKLCNLERPETRRLHADLILMHKIINGTMHVIYIIVFPYLILQEG